jgi:hypothetical protein
MTILNTLEVHSARPTTGRIATDVSAHATALPIANSSPKRYPTWNNALISDISSQTSEVRFWPSAVSARTAGLARRCAAASLTS